MSITRRGFLKGLLAIAAAPAVCKAENLMKIWVPPQKLVAGRGMTQCYTTVDELAFLSGDHDGTTVFCDEMSNIYRLSYQNILSSKHVVDKDLAQISKLQIEQIHQRYLNHLKKVNSSKGFLT